MPTKDNTLRNTLRALARAFGAPTDIEEHRPLEQLILLLLCRDADPGRARTALRRLQTEYVDWNEVRVSSAYEIAGHLRGLGGKAKALVKAERIKDLLSTVYNRFNKLNLDFLHVPSSDPELSRKRDRFLNYLKDMLKEARAEAARERRALKAREQASRKKTSRKTSTRKKTSSSKKTSTSRKAKKTAKKSAAGKASKARATRKKTAAKKTTKSRSTTASRGGRKTTAKKTSGSGKKKTSSSSR